MKSFSQFCAEATVLAKLGGVQGKLDKITGKFTKGAWSDTESARYQKYSNPATTTSTPSPSPATTSTPSPQGSTPAPVPKPKDERPTNRQVAAARKEAEYQSRARDYEQGIRMGGLAADQARQNYSTYHSPAMKAHRAKMAASVPNWKQHQFTQDMPAPGRTKDRDYGIPTFRADRRRENREAMVRANMNAGMSRQDAERRATTDEAELHRKNVGYQNYRNKK